MREILFRGKRKDIGKWVYGWFCPKDFEPSTFAVIDTPNIIREKDLLWCEVLPETVGQYTGLTDKNGKKIFEGDIVRVEYNGSNTGDSGIGSVAFENGVFGIPWGWHKDFIPLIGFCHHTFEVVGNVYDIAELQKEG